MAAGANKLFRPWVYARLVVERQYKSNGEENKKKWKYFWKNKMKEKQSNKNLEGLRERKKKRMGKEKQKGNVEVFARRILQTPSYYIWLQWMRQKYRKIEWFLQVWIF